MAVWSTVRISGLSSDVRWDAEHYRPDVLEQVEKLTALPTVPLINLADVSDGNHLTIADEFLDEGVRYLRGQDLTEFFISDADPVFISDKAYAALTRSHMHAGDVLVGIVGTIGTVGLVTKRHDKLTGSCKLAIVRPRSVPGEYIASYLASRLGQVEIQRRIRGAVQMGLILPDLKDLPVIAPSPALAQSVVKAVRDAQADEQQAAELSLAAELLLVRAIGLDAVTLSKRRSYSVSLSELQAEGRLDADYFNPRYQHVVKALRQGGRTLEDVAPLSERPFSADDLAANDSFQYIEIGSLHGDGTSSAESVLAADAPSRAAWIVRPGDVITSTVRPIRRLSALVSDSQDGYVCSSGFAVLTPSRGKDEIEPEVLLTFLRLPHVCEILNLYTTASMYPAVPMDRLMSLPVAMPPARIRKEIVSLVRRGVSARSKSARALKRARVLIESAAGITVGGPSA